MKILSRITALSLAVVFFATVFAACTTGKSDKNANDGDASKTNYIDISNYVIVRPDIASSDLTKAVSNLKKMIEKYTGANLDVVTDEDPAAQYEIVVGDCKRPEIGSIKEKFPENADDGLYVIDVLSNDIVILGASENATICAIKQFADRFVKTSDTQNCIALEKKEVSLKGKIGEVLYVSKDLNLVVLERSSTIAEPSDLSIKEEFSYGKIIKLEHQKDEKNNGILFATNENTQGKPWELYRSDDDGKSWKRLNRVPNSVNPDMNAGYQSYIYELPADVGEFKKGTLIFTGCCHSKKNTKLPIYTSTDLGKTWTGHGNVAIGNGFNDGGWSSDGIWEPVVMYENGRLYCFYSDELENGNPSTHAGGHNQRLVYKYTTDMKNWSEIHEMVALDDPALRPGMVALTRMGNGKWALAYEMVGEKGSPIYLKFAEALDSWIPAEKGKIIKNNLGKGLGSAPAIAWTPAGGECGTLFVVSKDGGSGIYETSCDLYMSFDYGETFVSIKNPINIQNHNKVRCGYSAGMFVDKEGSLYYVNNEVYSNKLSCGKLIFNKIKVY